jgi:hypothetical protein
LDEIREDYRKLIIEGIIKSRDKVVFICPEHGEYTQKLNKHARGQGCPKCGRIKQSTSKIRKDYPFMDEIREDYQEKIRNGEITSKDKVPFICPIHGEYLQTLNDHEQNHGCPKCGRISNITKQLNTNYSFMDEIREDYQLLIKNGKINSKTKIPFICKEHGEYWQTLNSHSNGQGCPKCSNISSNIKHRKTDYPFINEIREDYQEKIRNGEINQLEKIPFICPIHGEYWQLLSVHINHGCPKCGFENSALKRTNINYLFMDEIREDYQEKISNGKLNNITKVPFICKEHGEYWQTLNNHSNGQGCPKCVLHISKEEIEVYKYIRSILPSEIEILNNIRNLIPDRSIESDIYIPSLKIGIEYNGLIWHSEKYSKELHNIYNKMKLFQDNGIRIINIFEDEWLHKKNLVKKKLLHILNMDKSEKVFARKCIVKGITSIECKSFLNNNHIQGSDGSGYRYGLYYKNRVVAVMTFKKGKASQKSKDWEMSRYATNCNVIGGFDKLFKYAHKELLFDKIITFADLRWSDLNNNIYEKTGWTKEYTTKPNYFYVTTLSKCKRIHRYNMRKSELHNKLKSFDPKLTEVENCNNNGYYRLFDCGNIKYSKTFIIEKKIEKEKVNNKSNLSIFLKNY